MTAGNLYFRAVGAHRSREKIANREEFGL